MTVLKNTPPAKKTLKQARWIGPECDVLAWNQTMTSHRALAGVGAGLTVPFSV